MHLDIVAMRNLLDSFHVRFLLSANLAAQFQDFGRTSSFQSRSRLYPGMDPSFQESAEN